MSSTDTVNWKDQRIIITGDCSLPTRLTKSIQSHPTKKPGTKPGQSEIVHTR